MPRALALTTSSNSKERTVFDYQKSLAYFRDGFVPFNEANLSVASSPVLYGLSVYTVFSANWNNKQQKLYVFRLREHYQRLVNSAKIMDFDNFANEWPYERFADVTLELLTRNKVAEDVLVRTTVYIDELIAGTRIHGLRNSLSAYIYPMGEILPRSGIHACISSWMHTPDNVIPSRAKVNGLYVNNSLMKNEALLNGYDDAISIDENGHVSEGSVANLFIVRGGKLITPGPSTDILEGITRDSIIKIAQDLGILVEERDIDRSELYIADEAFMCGSSVRITPVLSIDKRPVGDDQLGQMTEKLAEAYDSAQRGTTAKYRSWRLAV